MTNAHAICAEANLDFKELYFYQYLVTHRKTRVAGLKALPFGRFTAHVGAKLHSALLVDCKGRFFGYVLGIAVDKSGLIKGEHQLEELDLGSGLITRI
jgi:hypothetical protein